MANGHRATVNHELDWLDTGSEEGDLNLPGRGFADEGAGLAA